MLGSCRSPAMACRWGFTLCLFHLIYTVRPCLIHTCHAAPVPCHDHAVLKATSEGHGTARHGHGMACVNYPRQSRDGMWATCSLSISSGYHAVFHDGCYQKHIHPLNCRTSSSDISGYHADFTKDTVRSENGRGAAWHVWINAARHGRERHATCELTRHAMAGNGMPRVY
jgi:hypothetical protein